MRWPGVMRAARAAGKVEGGSGCMSSILVRLCMTRRRLYGKRSAADQTGSRCSPDGLVAMWQRIQYTPREGWDLYSPIRSYPMCSLESEFVPADETWSHSSSFARFSRKRYYQ